MTDLRLMIEVVAPGLLTTVQDLGRPGFMGIGVTPGGALDRSALVLGNRLVGNEPGAAALEVTLLGPRLRFSGTAIVALTGAHLGASIDGDVLPSWQPFRVDPGAEIAFLPSAVAGPGARAYVCVAGGIDVELIMTSRSTDLFGGFGGWHGRALHAGDAIPVGASRSVPDDLLRRRLSVPPPERAPDRPIRAVLGPQEHRFTSDGIAAFFESDYRVLPQSDRMGLRLSGTAIELVNGADMISEGIAHGAVQVPGSGQPIALLAARQTIGGYPKIATAIAADLDALGQRRPGDPVRFEKSGVSEARSLALAYHAELGEGSVVVGPPSIPGWSSPPTGADEEITGMPAVEGWTPDGIARLVDALRGANVMTFRLELVSAGLTLDVSWQAPTDGVADPPAEALERGPMGHEAAGGEVVRAPLLGVFFRRPSPDEPVFVEEGQPVEAGATIGLIEVMKTYHEVTAPRAGASVAFLVEEGDTVEYGQPIAEID